MRITVKQLRGIIRQELNKNIVEGYADPELKRIFSSGKLSPGDVNKLSSAVEGVKRLVANRELLTIANKLKSMSDSHTAKSVVAKFVNTMFDEDTKKTIAAGLALVSPEQLNDLVLEPSFGDVDVLSSELITTRIEDPLDAIEKLKAMKGDQPIQNLWVVAYQIRKLHEILTGVAKNLAAQSMSAGSMPTGSRKGFFANLFN